MKNDKGLKKIVKQNLTIKTASKEAVFINPSPATPSLDQMEFLAATLYFSLFCLPARKRLRNSLNILKSYANYSM